jgi:hypothetical protein
MSQRKFIAIMTLWLALSLNAGAAEPTTLSGLATGTIYLSSSELSGGDNSKIYSVTLLNQVGTGTVSYALALAGFEGDKTPSGYFLKVDQVNFAVGNTKFDMVLSFQSPFSGGYVSVWGGLKWTYLVVAATFDGSYSNIWATNVQVDPSSNSYFNVPIDPVGLEFLGSGREEGDC